MRKVVIHQAGDYRQLMIEQWPDLVPADDQILVEVKACGINYADVIIRWGLYESAKRFVGWPITPGFEFAGVVRQVGKNCTRYQSGDHVFGVSLFNSYASQVVVPQDQLYPLPLHLSFEQGAGFPAVFLTAYHALFQNVVVRKGMTALIHSAAGGVGSSLVQLCKVAGITSIGVVGSAHKVKLVQDLGCDFVIDKSSEDLWGRVAALAPKGVDLVFDANGADSLRRSYQHLASCGKLVAYGAHSMFPKTGGRVNWPKLVVDYFKTPRFNPLDMTSENKSLITFNLSFLFARKDLFGEAMHQLLEWFDQGKIKAPPVKAYPLEDVGHAHMDLESGKTVGKLVLTP